MTVPLTTFGLTITSNAMIATFAGLLVASAGISPGVALAGEPRLLFLDEPTQGMGASGRSRLFELVAELKRNFTIVMIEHDMQFLFSLADRISVIHWGQVIAEGTPAELAADPWVQRANLGVDRHA